ncbi:MAG: MarR family winged helix-turn-helix transcriptional regulator [Deltaproteobacteria bacterium]|nr:MarR family winged helix-turn-helix transcriptional regulator [Deltaproteobacteria bacterium]
MIILQIGKIRDKANSFLAKELINRQMRGIAPTHGDIIWALLTFGDLPMKKLAEIIHRDKSTVTALVKKLIKFGYVEKKINEADNRVNIISLTKKGRAMRSSFWEVSEALRKRAYRGLSDREKKTLMRLLIKIHDNF